MHPGKPRTVFSWYRVCHMDRKLNQQSRSRLSYRGWHFSYFNGNTLSAAKKSHLPLYQEYHYPKNIMKRRITNYIELQEEKVRLRELLQVQGAQVRQDIDEIKEELKPVSN